MEEYGNRPIDSDILRCTDIGHSGDALKLDMAEPAWREISAHQPWLNEVKILDREWKT